MFLGKKVYANKDRYEGKWENDQRIGEGKIIYNNGEIFDGEWKNDAIGDTGRTFFIIK